MAGIFISYRRDNSRHASGRLADDLAQAFGASSIFRDIEGIEPGVDFTRSLEKALRSCAVMLVVIGPQWLDAADASGQRRLDQPEDWVRLEIETALARDIRVIPILLEGTPLPPADRLPAALQPLLRRQAVDLSDARWRSDVERLVQTLAKVPGIERVAPLPPAPAPTPRSGGRKPLWVGAAVGIGAIALLASLFEAGDGGDIPEAVPGSGGATRLAVPPAPAEREPLMAASPPRDGAPAPRAVPDVSGLWRTGSGETYVFEQQGRSVSFTAEMGGQSIGSGRGQFDDGVLRLTMTMRVQGVVMGAANCDLQPAPDQRSWAGMCMGPTGAFMAQMFR